MKYWSIYGWCLTFPIDCILVRQTFLIPESKLYLNVISYYIRNKKYIIHPSSDRRAFKYFFFTNDQGSHNSFLMDCRNVVWVTWLVTRGGEVECRDPRQDSIKTNSDKQTNTWSPGPHWDLSVRTILQEFNLKLKLLKYAKLIDWQVQHTGIGKTKQRLILMERFKCQAH